ncbi:hypothetical protein MTR_5g058360 [Medicago truncatula]|uniref:Uncharacterized protein n=1 Tax=Medicago truncatula TaxID=3880 RepID=G7K8R8_MEDTR|nr:hypothetical protein MTR_5g058360 [Medicago truncatula]
MSLTRGSSFNYFQNDSSLGYTTRSKTIDTTTSKRSSIMRYQVDDWTKTEPDTLGIVFHQHGKGNRETILTYPFMLVLMNKTSIELATRDIADPSNRTNMIQKLVDILDKINNIERKDEVYEEILQIYDTTNHSDPKEVKASYTRIKAMIEPCLRNFNISTIYDIQMIMHNNVMSSRSMNVVFTRIDFIIQKGLVAQLVARLPSIHM